ncbi:phage tail protein [Erythrobacter sp.]|jgi:microcystin-dependent protein|uniref:phage tail protein n=1 Tax=Erythrobacter sp. TaxID=1042 RepID=UPI002EA94C7F|nr:phage tail protein [Erythrobacter sp.]
MTNAIIRAAALALALGAFPGAPASAQEDYLGKVITVAANFCPRGTLPADGRLLPIARYTALFSLLGTQYGGDGRTTFALPDLAGATASANGRALKHCVVAEGIYPSRS